MCCISGLLVTVAIATVIVLVWKMQVAKKAADSEKIEPSKKSPEMNAVLDGLHVGVYGITRSEAIEQRICISCKETVIIHGNDKEESLTDIELAEYKISALCKNCQERAFAPLED